MVPGCRFSILSPGTSVRWAILAGGGMAGYALPSPRLEARCLAGEGEGRAADGVGPRRRASMEGMRGLEGRGRERRGARGGRRRADRPLKGAADEATSSPPRPSAQPRMRFFGVGQRSERIVLYYWTGWKNPAMHCSQCGGPWQDVEMSKVASSSSWFMVDMEVDMNNCNGRGFWMEFVMTDHCGSWDKPSRDKNYMITGPGRYVLRDGEVEKVRGESVLVVSDLDGTMVGNDAATGAFRDFWEQEAVLRGSVLVYNTGRNLQSFKGLLAEKSGVLAVPDILISAVGTKIYRNNGGSFEEDEAWSSQLDKGWRLSAVREAAYSALALVGKEAMHFRPPEEQNDHKVTCGVRNDVLPHVLEHMGEVLKANYVKAKLITSGTGDWRFLDVVSDRAGKFESLDYIRKQQGFPLTSTVACGDSGNDILMLSGPNLAIVVGNAQQDLKEWVAQQKNGRDGSRLWMSTKPEALGILEGLEHFGFGCNTVS
eukprot:evm.model.scf_87.1 EVM.evm.TU.scf_87.1   scf_87:8029-14871(-)